MKRIRLHYKLYAIPLPDKNNKVIVSDDNIKLLSLVSAIIENKSYNADNPLHLGTYNIQIQNREVVKDLILTYLRDNNTDNDVKDIYLSTINHADSYGIKITNLLNYTNIDYLVYQYDNKGDLLRLYGIGYASSEFVDITSDNSNKFTFNKNKDIYFNKNKGIYCVEYVDNNDLIDVTPIMFDSYEEAEEYARAKLYDICNKANNDHSNITLTINVIRDNDKVAAYQLTKNTVGKDLSATRIETFYIRKCRMNN